MRARVLLGAMLVALVPTLAAGQPPTTGTKSKRDLN